MIHNPLIGYTDEEIRLEMLIRTTLNRGWAGTAKNLNDVLMYVKRAHHTERALDLHQDKDTTVNRQLIEYTADLSNIKEL